MNTLLEIIKYLFPKPVPIPTSVWEIIEKNDVYEAGKTKEISAPIGTRYIQKDQFGNLKNFSTVPSEN